MVADRPKPDWQGGFAGLAARSRLGVERGLSAALSVLIVGLLLAGLMVSLADRPRHKGKDRSPTLTVVTLAPARQENEPVPKHETTAVPSVRAKRERGTTSTNAPRSSLPTPPMDPSPAIPASPTITSANAPLPSFKSAPAAANDTSALDLYRQQLWTIIAARRPPGVHLNGEVGIIFDLDAEGSLRSVKVIRSSGDPMMDRLALGTVRRAAPFPKPPIEDRASLTFEIRFRFR